MSENIKLPLASPDPAADLLAQLREAAPQVFGEGKVDFDKLRTALGGHVDAGPERYGLTWAGKSDAFRNVQAPSVGTLLPMPEESVDWDNTENLIIEGDNLEVLKLLQKSYHGKVKMIYIDPPYNTGNEFIYPDNYREGLEDYLRYSGQVSDEGIKHSTNTETSGRFHSKWLSMMYPRLFLARNLLREDGVIFVSIDDNEVHDLRMLMNEVFGEENFIDCIIWKKRYGGGAKEKYLVSVHEYILLYARNLSEISEIFIPTTQESIDRYYKDKDENFEKRGPYRTHPLEATKSMGERKNLVFPVTAPDGAVILPKRQWLWSKERVNEAIAKKELAFLKDKDGNWAVHTKQYLKDDNGNIRGSKAFSIIDNVFTQHGTNEIIDLFGDAQIFPFPKPSALIKNLLNVGLNGDTDAIALDFFAGSGTLAHAILESNNNDAGVRKFILVQLPEKIGASQYPTIAHITRERVRKVIQKLTRGRTGKLGLEDNKKSYLGFRAFKLSSSNFRIWNSEKTPDDPEKLAEQLKLYADNVERKRTQQDILYELILKSGLLLSCKVERIEVEEQPVWSVNDSKLLILLENNVTREVLRGMLLLKPQQMLCLDAAFNGDDALKTNTVLEARSQGVAFHTV